MIRLHRWFLLSCLVRLVLIDIIQVVFMIRNALSCVCFYDEQGQITVSVIFSVFTGYKALCEADLMRYCRPVRGSDLSVLKVL